MKLFTGLVLVLGLLAAAVYHWSPAIRTSVGQHIHNVWGWTAEAKARDPVGFIRHARSRMKQQLGELQSLRRTLDVELVGLEQQERRQSLTLQRASQLADEFRQAYRQGQFPVVVHGAAYDESQLKTQVSSLLAEAEGSRGALDAIRQIRRQVEDELQRLAVGTIQTEAQLSLLSAQRGLLEAQLATHEGDRLMREVEELVADNDVLLAANPVRSVRQLIASTSARSDSETSSQRVREFLTQATEEVDTPGRDANGSNEVGERQSFGWTGGKSVSVQVVRLRSPINQ